MRHAGRPVCMEFDLHPSVTLQSGTFNALIAPEAIVAGALNGNRELRKYLLLYVCGGTSRLLPALTCRSPDFEVRQALTAGQIPAIVAGSRHTLIFVEHDPSLYEGAGAVTGEVGRVLHEAGMCGMVVLYASREDASFRMLSRQADRIFYIAPPVVPPGPRPHRPPRKRHAERSLPGQTLLEGF